MSVHYKSLAKKSNPDPTRLFMVDGAVLLPSCDLPLNVFEPRYLNMVDDALRTDRLISMLQPVHDDESDKDACLIGRIGTLGRLIQFSETEDGRYMIVLRGLKRFEVNEVLKDDDHPYRRAKVDFSPFLADIETHARSTSGAFSQGSASMSRDKSERAALTMAIRSYSNSLNVELDWDHMKTISTNRLVDQACMISPFRPDDKQSLLEAATHGARRRLLIGLMHLHSNLDPYSQTPSPNDDGPRPTLQ